MDAGLVLGQLAEATGVRLADDGACPGGHVGACYVRWPGGRRSVLTSAPAGTAAGVRRVESLLAAARAYRVPAPHYELVAELPTMVAVVQQRLPGVEEIGAAVPGHLAGDDLVHFDFHPENVLADAAGAVTGVVDWDGASRGDGYLDLYTLRFDLARRAPDLGRWLAGQLHDAAPDDVVAGCWAHMSLRLVDWVDPALHRVPRDHVARGRRVPPACLTMIRADRKG
jgi:hypothetical protein